ncbi:MAG: response regulator [Acidimicrobiales bacterium]
MNSRHLKSFAAMAPTVVAVSAVEYSAHSEFVLPIPIPMLFLAVGLGGVIAGRRVGSLSGMLAVGMFLHLAVDTDAIQGAPATGLELVVGIIAIAAFGYASGWLHDTARQDLARQRLETRRVESNYVAQIDATEMRYMQALDVARVGVWTWDLETDRCTHSSDLNAAMSDMTPTEFMRRCRGPRGSSLVHPDDRAGYLRMCALVEAGETVNHEYRGLTKSGDTIYLRETLAPALNPDGEVVELLGTVVDITDLRLTEQQLQQTQKMEAVGQLTAGVAHDFNNLLTVVLGNLELADAMVDDPRIARALATATRAANQGAELTHQLLTVGRRAMLDPTPLDPNEVVRSLRDLLQRTLPEISDIELVLDDEATLVRADRAQLESALLNLAINARDARPIDGRITISTRAILITPEAARSGTDPGSYVGITISDAGVGMTTDVATRACEPFYSTKTEGEGSGLGLAMVDGFVRQSGGFLDIESVTGLGTSITIHLPSAVEIGLQPQRGDCAFSHHDAGRRALLVDDRDDVREVLAGQLTSLGFDVVDVADADAALDMLKTADAIDLVVTDVVMPGPLQGPELVERIREHHPDVGTLLVSGYPKSAVDSELLSDSRVPMLQKPFSTAEFEAAIAAALLSHRARL